MLHRRSARSKTLVVLVASLAFLLSGCPSGNGGGSGGGYRIDSGLGLTETTVALARGAATEPNP
ncbi:MAG: hypothetical protein QOF52_701 [Propionibacteriaceae bacterium]|jgi:hypothetical protein|nr:hypothetical protein [Propionibacteriaceae bacterium]MDX6320843.1 hypothetical protein [Propionibacteriaceae bacterium]